MAYTSDLRGKNLLTDVDMKVRKKLADNNIQVDLNFRVFDESNEDAVLWKDGGLTFNDPKSGLIYGSNDGGWEIKGEPILIVEATFGTERGQFGNGQLNRLSHPVGVAMNGYYAVLLEPYHGQSFLKDKTMKGLKSKNIGYQNGNLNKELAYAALNFSKSKGKILILDPYNITELEDLLYALVLNKIGLPNNLNLITDSVFSRIRNYLGSDYKIGERTPQKLNRVYFTDGSCRTDGIRIFSHNLEALTTPSKRDGHGMFGKALVELCAAKNICTFIFIRMDNNDFNILYNRNSKEFHFLYNHPAIDLYNFDDLVFDDMKLKQKVLKARKTNYLTTSGKPLWNELKQAFESGYVQIKSR